MIRRPPRSTRTDTLFPYTTLFRSHRIGLRDDPHLPPFAMAIIKECQDQRRDRPRVIAPPDRIGADTRLENGRDPEPNGKKGNHERSDERREGKACVSTCRSRWWPHHSKNNQLQTTAGPRNRKTTSHTDTNT